MKSRRGKEGRASRRLDAKKPRVYASSFSGGRIIERGSFSCAGYASMRSDASKLKLRAAVFGVFSRGNLDHRTRNLLCAGNASTRGYASKLRLRVPVFVVFCRGTWIIERGNFLCAGYASTRGYASK